MQLDCDIEQPWPDNGWEDLAQKVVGAAGKIAPELANQRLIVSLLFTSDDHIHALNREWRERDKPTNVLSFPMLARDEVLKVAAQGPPVMLGDIALAYETCAREAAEKSVSIEDHASHLLCHGLLHLAGYDHEISDQEADKMEDLEVKALALLQIADPYGGLGA